MREIFQYIKTSLILLGFMTLLTGVVYPLVVTLLAQTLFKTQANGSLIFYDGKWVGSQHIGQFFKDPQYFWGRPSATTPFPYRGDSSSASNLGSLNPEFLRSVRERMTMLQKIDPHNQALIPVDLVTASASGLDPEISPLAANYQVPRIARLRGISEKELYSLIEKNTQGRTWKILGEPRVNVLRLNLALDEWAQKSSQGASS